MRILALPVLLAVLPSSAFADEHRLADGPSSPRLGRDIPTPDGDPDDHLPVAIGMNLPIRWGDAASVAGSFYIGVSKRVAIRANFATYKYTDDAVGALAALAGAETEDSRGGRITDVGVGLVHYSNKLWDGFTFEGGLLHRDKDIHTQDEFRTPEYIGTSSTTYAVRGLVGWSWLIGEHVFVATAFGASAGRELGTEETGVKYASYPMTTTRDVSRWDLAPEGYIRIGGAF